MVQCYVEFSDSTSPVLYHDAQVIQAALNTAIAQAVDQYPGVTLVDISSLLGGPELRVRPLIRFAPLIRGCSRGATFDGSFWRALHPNIIGQAAIAQAIEAVVGHA